MSFFYNVVYALSLIMKQFYAVKQAELLIHKAHFRFALDVVHNSIVKTLSIITNKL